MAFFEVEDGQIAHVLVFLEEGGFGFWKRICEVAENVAFFFCCLSELLSSCLVLPDMEILLIKKLFSL